jgi:hypothetical protein
MYWTGWLSERQMLLELVIQVTPGWADHARGWLDVDMSWRASKLLYVHVIM